MTKFIVNTIGFSLVLLGAAQGINSFLAVQVTGEPLALTTAGAFILIITNILGE